MDYQRFQQALRLIGQKASSRSTANNTGDLAEGTEQAVDTGPGTPEEWNKLAVASVGEGDTEAAVAAWAQALQCDLDDLSLLHRIAEGLRAIGRDPVEVAERNWGRTKSRVSTQRRALGKRLHAVDWQSACVAVLGGKWDEALHIMQAQFKARETSRRIARNLAFLLERMGQPGRAQCVMATNLLARGEARAAAHAFLAAPEADAQSPEYLRIMLSALRMAGEEAQVLRIAEAAATRESCPPAARVEWAETLLDLHRYEDAYAVLRDGASQLDDPSLRLGAGLILPAVPASQADMERAHQRVHRNIHALSGTSLPEDGSSLEALEEALVPNFYLSYLGMPCVDEIRAYGRFIHDVVAARFPKADNPISPSQHSVGTRLKIGYATSFANQHTVSRYFCGWLQHADRQVFELHLFPLAGPRDWMTGYLSSLVDHCHPHATDTAMAMRQIQEAGLDLLVYPEIGMDKLSLRLAALRLAPVQCVALGHPVSTGLPTIDYFISNSMEPEDASSHYTERLVSLPGSGVCMPLPAQPAVRKSREDFGLSPDVVVYLSAQSLFKYLPRYDDLFARIAMDVENAVFVFAEGEYPAWTQTLLVRLQHHFKSRGLDPEQYIRILPPLSFGDFQCLNAISDIFLDTIGWSAGMTAFDALSCDLPMVVLPGTLMRGRQSYGMLMQLGIEDTIATDADDYVRIAVKLGRDRGWRTDVSRRIRERRHLLFDDTRCVKSLEAFFRWSVDAAQPGDDAMFKLWPEPRG